MTVYLNDPDFTLHVGDALTVLRELPDESADCCVTSPPYLWLRQYGEDEAEIGRELAIAEYVAALTSVFREVRRVLTPAATLWLNLGDSYSNEGKSGGVGLGKNYTSALGGYDRTLRRTGLKPKELCGIPWEVAFALRADGWTLRRDVIWDKSNAMPDGAQDRPTSAHEYLFMLTKQPTYYWDKQAAQEPAAWDRWGAQTNPKGSGWITAAPDDLAARDSRNIRSVWRIPTANFPAAHFAVMPDELATRCILLSTRPGECVLDPFMGAGTTALSARKHGRMVVGIELYEDNCRLIAERLSQLSLLSDGVAS